MRFVISLLIWIAGTTLTAALCLASFVIKRWPLPVRDRERLIHRQCFWWSDALVSMNPFWKLRVDGLENIDHARTYVIVANHQSLADIILIYKIRMYFKWVAKEELLKVPFIGALLKLNGHILITRDELGSIKEAYREAASRLREGVSILFFPEGTRSSTEEMGEFKNGAFKLAIKEKTPVLPVYIGGTREAIPKGGFVFKAKVSGRISVLPAVDTAGMQAADFERLRERVRGELKTAAVARHGGPGHG
jgi:1-acyl-sn-glycerol-3-phosphate acyltransferase